MNISESRVLVICGAGLVGVHIVDHLPKENVREIVVLDNFMRGSKENLAQALTSPKVTILEGDIRNLDCLEQNPC